MGSASTEILMVNDFLKIESKIEVYFSQYDCSFVVFKRANIFQ